MSTAGTQGAETAAGETDRAETADDRSKTGVAGFGAAAGRGVSRETARSAPTAFI